MVRDFMDAVWEFLFGNEIIKQCNAFDFVLAVLCLMSAIFAYINGIVKEVLSIIKWWVPIVVAYFYPIRAVSRFVKHYSESVNIQIFAGCLTTFLIAFFFAYIILREIHDRIVDKQDSIFSLNKVLGAFFGIFRMLFLVFIVLAVFPNLGNLELLSKSYSIGVMMKDSKMKMSIDNSVKKTKELKKSSNKKSSITNDDDLYNELVKSSDE